MTSGTRTQLMTVGELSRRTGVPIRALREYTDSGLIYTEGRSESNYRLFTADALWCVQWIGQLRGLGLTLAEIRDLARHCPQGNAELIGPRLADLLRTARARLDARIAELQRTRARIDEFEATHHAELAGRTSANGWTDDPRRCADCA
ncbi:DNA-binding transcriptional MerR regulator [Amycolatopsis echigonensis]|uniref:DNA-binding transcriptional MerR regulator n=2 Tax=Pseudonocardiaceae TaxID=2070 RepID=A0A2N3WJN4_9PSEU|nr:MULTISPECIES: MerR family transcriptional regulator [Pseudonocardiaceae]AEA23561.1 transcriptional regulator, MerR family [Pseudonocardia dioxanivorans CB1190]PKV94075.1 DNA-binding transcriptional MerR regulator [Amycolatopsis niigatensis]